MFKETTQTAPEKKESAPAVEFSLSSQVVEALSRRTQEPEWLRHRRLEALALFEKQPFPKPTDEDWRRTDFSRLDLNAIGIGTNGRPQTPQVPPDASLFLNKPEAFAGRLLSADGNVTARSLQKELQAKGVIFKELKQAVREHPDLLQKYFMTQAVKAADGKFLSLHQALVSSGFVLYVPRGVEVALPLHAFFWSDGHQTSQFPHTLVVAEPDSRVILIDEFASVTRPAPSFCDNVAELFVGRNAQVVFVHLQRWGENVTNLYKQRAVLEENAQLVTLSVNLGAAYSRIEVESELVAPGASSLMFGLSVGAGKQQIEHHTLQEHVAHHTTSDLLFKTALLDQAYSVFSGLIRVKKDAQRTDAYQANRNLILSPKAKADTLPKLEILANDVRCTHGATVGPIDEEQCFYLMSRGLPRTDTERIVVNGFFEEVLKRVPVGNLKEQLLEYIDRKVLV